MRICNVVLAWNQWSVFRNLDENHAFFHSFVRGHWAYGKNAILEWECAFYLTFGTFLEVCIRFFFTFAVSSCVKPAGIIVQVQEICWTLTKRIDSSCSVRSIQHVCNFNDVITPHPHPTHPPQPHVLRSVQHVCNFNDVITPHPTHPPQPHVLRSIQHVCNFNDVITPHSTHPPQPHVLRSIQHVCNFNDVITPHPTHPPQPNPRDRREGKCIYPTVYSGRSTFRNASLRPTGAKNKQPTNLPLKSTTLRWVCVLFLFLEQG